MKWLNQMIEMVAPSHCIGCDTMDSVRHHWCPACLPLLEAVQGRAWQPPSSQAALFLFCGPLADGLRRAKYGGRLELWLPLARMLAAQAHSYGGIVQAVIPMPLHQTRLRERGYNQSAILARQVAKALRIPVHFSVLARVRATLAQAGLDETQRLRNVCGAFEVRVQTVPETVLLIDDVRTTGATMSEASWTLRQAGVRRVFGLTLAKTP